MPTGFFLIFGVVLFFIIFAAVRLAVEPLIQNNQITSLKSDLSFLNDIGVLENKEYKSIKRTVEKKQENENKQKQIDKYSVILEELKEEGIISEEAYEDKINKLETYYLGD